MPRLTRDSNVTVGTKDYKIEELLKTIIFLPADQIKTFFMELGLKVPQKWAGKLDINVPYRGMVNSK